MTRREELTTIEVAQYFSHAPEKLWWALTTPELIGYPKGDKADINRDSIWKRAEELGGLDRASDCGGE